MKNFDEMNENLKKVHFYEVFYFIKCFLFPRNFFYFTNS